MRKKHLCFRYQLILLQVTFQFFVCVSLLRSNVLGQNNLSSKSHDSSFIQKEIVCSDFDVRKPSSISKIKKCTVIEGNLLIVMTKLLETASVPNLREITGFLVIYDLTGISRLSKLFPNLTVIRGQSLIYNFALVIRSTSLKYIELPSLRVIQRGGVRVDQNANLCYVRTVNWEHILGKQTSAAAPIRLLSNRLICPDTCQVHCGESSSEILVGAASFSSLSTSDVKSNSSSHQPSNKKESLSTTNGKSRGMQTPGFCWSSTHCQSVCSLSCTAAGLACEMRNSHQCCHPECLAGCYGPGADACVACKGALHQGVCVSQCPSGTYLYQGRRCVTASECFNMSTGRMLPSVMQPQASPPSPITSSLSSSLPSPHTLPVLPVLPRIQTRFALHQGTCVLDCPTAHQRDNVTGKCQACGNKCPRIRCNRLLIHSLKALSKLKDCYSAYDLYITIHEGDSALIKQEFDAAFASLREVEQSIKIIRASALTSLSFLRHLRLIGTGQNRSTNLPVLEVRGNDNLVELWDSPQNDSSAGLKVASDGLVHFILNRNLCPKRVFELRTSGALHLPEGRDFKLEERELARRTNGKMAFCERTDLHLRLGGVRSTSAELRWLRLINSNAVDKPMSTLALVFYQATNKNVSFYSGRLSCGDDPWNMLPSSCNVSQMNTTSEVENSSSFCSETLRQLKPATRYAAYVETKQLFSQMGNMSNIVYFTTESSNPSPPRFERLQAVNNSSILVKWLPPVNSNGHLDVYLVWFRAIQINQEDYLYRDFCFAKPDWLTPSKRTSSRNLALTAIIGGVWSVSSWERKRSLCTCPAHSLNNFSQCDAICDQDSILELRESLWSTDSNDAVLTIKYGGRIRIGEIGLMIVPATSEDTSSPTDVLFSSSTHQFHQKRHLNVTISNLSGFSQHIIELQACQKPVDGDICPTPPWKNLSTDYPATIIHSQEWTDCFMKYCSPRVFKTQRTLFTDHVDNVPYDSIRFDGDTSGTMYTYWSAPKKPNGIILYYVLRYRRLEDKRMTKTDSDAIKTKMVVDNVTIQTTQSLDATEKDSPAWSTLCVSGSKWHLGGESKERKRRSNNDQLDGFPPPKHEIERQAVGNTSIGNSYLKSFQKNDSLSFSSRGGAELLNLLPGSYELQIMAVSLAGNSSWTELVVFEVELSPQSTAYGRRILVTIVCLAVLAVLLALLVACVIHRVRKKRLLASTWQSSNPEYWHVYEVDDWEMQLEDIDTFNFRYILGRGNFGMVYRGSVKTLRTPACSHYTDHTNIPAAIKTLSSTSTVFDRRDFINEACYMKQFQNFHLIRLFGVVSKGSPSSARHQKNIKLNLRNLFLGLWRSILSARKMVTSENGVSGEICGKLVAGPNEQNAGIELTSKRYGRPPGASLTESEATDLKHSVTTEPTLSESITSKVDGATVSPSGVFASTSCCPLRRRPPVKVSSLLEVEKEFEFPMQPQQQQQQQHFSGPDSAKLFSPYGPFAVMELMENGDLATYLRKLGDSGIGSVSSAQAYLWAVQIADGMAYLERKKYVHRDLAARNCLVDDRGVVKIGDFGLCRDIYERNYYHKVGAGKLPVRWMAPESLQSAYFTSKSDVWSFGVVLWEISTMACLPYQGKSHEEVFSYVIDGNTLISNGAPINCPPLLQSLMLYCWAYRPIKRPTFLHLITLLAPRFADADFRQASYYYQGDVNSELVPPAIEAEKKSTGPGGTEFTDLPTLLRTVLGRPDSDEDSSLSSGRNGVFGGGESLLMNLNPPLFGCTNVDHCSFTMDDSIEEIY